MTDASLPQQPGPIIGVCVEHDSPGEFYGDGSAGCLYCCTVETSCRCTRAVEPPLPRPQPDPRLGRQVWEAAHGEQPLPQPTKDPGRFVTDEEWERGIRSHPVEPPLPRCVECGESWPCTATVTDRKSKVPHRIGAVYRSGIAASVPLPVDPERGEPLDVIYDVQRTALRTILREAQVEGSWQLIRATATAALALAAPTPTAPPALDVERLAVLLQRIDGNHDAFVSRVHAERLLPLLSGTEPAA